MAYNKPVLFVILIFLIVSKFFNFGPITGFNGYNYLLDYGLIALLILSLKTFYGNKHKQDDITKIIYALLIMFAFSFLWPFIFWGQGMWQTIRGMQSVLPLVLFFVFVYYKLPIKKVLVAMFFLCISYIVILNISLATFPNNIFGANQYFNENANLNLEQRGIVRIDLPGSDFIPVIIFAIVTLFKKKKYYYLLLIPLFAALLMRGTRTPFVMCVLICTIYYLYSLKHKSIAILLGIFLCIGISTGYDYLLKSNSDDILTHYVQLTDAEAKDNNEGETNVRILMYQYFFTEFNKNPISYFVGNGASSGGSSSLYDSTLSKLAHNKGLCVNDALYSNIFIYFGIIGLFLYLRLLYIVLKTRVSEDAMFAKLYIIYVYLIGFTNVQLLTIAPAIFAMNLYVVHKGNIGKFSWRNLFYKNL